MKYKHIHKELLEWKEENIITPEQYEILEKRYKPEKWDIAPFYKQASSKKIKMYLMFIFIFLGSLAWISEFFRATNEVLSNTFNDFITIGGIIIVVIGLLYFGDYLADTGLNTVKYIGQTIIVIGGLLATFVVFYIDFKIFNRFNIKIFGNDWALFMLISAIVLWLISYKIRENALLGYVISLLCIWFISEGKIYSGSYFGNWLGLTLPIRLIIFSLIFILFGEFHSKREKIFKITNLSHKYRFFSDTYYLFGFIIMFVPSFLASIGKINPNPILSLRAEMLIYLLISLAISIFIICIFGLLNNSEMFLKLGLAFFAVIVYGNLYKVFQNNIGSPVFIILIVILSILVAIVIEYTMAHDKDLKKELTNELLKRNKG